MNEEQKVKKYLAPTVEQRKEVKKAINDYAYYVLIALVSILVTFIPPLVLGSLTGEFTTVFPSTPLAWVMWGVMNGSTAVGNVSILVFFKQQAKKNCKDNPNYIEATKILNELSGNKNVFIPRSPQKMNSSEYVSKAICIVLSTVASFFTIASLVVNFSLMSLLSTLVSVIIAIIFSWVTMLKNEEYWTEEYLLYAKMVRDQYAKESSESSVKEEEPIKETENA